MWDHPVLLGTLIQIRDNHALPIHVVADLYVDVLFLFFCDKGPFMLVLATIYKWCHPIRSECRCSL